MHFVTTASIITYYTAQMSCTVHLFNGVSVKTFM